MESVYAVIKQLIFFIQHIKLLKMTSIGGEKRTSLLEEEEFEPSKKTHIIENEKIAFINMESKKDCVKDQQVSISSELTKDNKEYFNGVEICNLSKSQLKKYRKMLKWIDVKQAKRAKEKLKTKEKRLHAKLNNIDLGPSRKELKQVKMKNSLCKIGICIDLSFDELMINKDMAKTIKQILRVYTLNRRSKAPMQLHLTNFNGRSMEEMTRHHGYENWDLYFHSEDYLQIFPLDKLVYLTSESDNVLSKLEDDKIYIIGGLVDHNSHKGICYKKAVEQGIAHARLPIGEYFWMKHRKVLTINQVFEILLGVSEGKSFKEAFELILPKRIEKVSTDQAQTMIGSNDNKDESK